MTNIIIAKTNQDYKLIAELATIIWREHYIPIIDIGQVEYMLKKYQTSEAITNQIDEGYLYYIINYKEKSVGYISIKKEEQTLFLSKIYVSKDYRGKKIGKTALQFIDDKALELNCTKIRLTVNKNNINSVSAYKKLGFINKGDVIIDIGNGFVMDDYKMEKPISFKS